MSTLVPNSGSGPERRLNPESEPLAAGEARDAHPPWSGVSAHDEAALISRAVSGDEEALSALLERHGPVVRGRITKDLPRRWQSVLSVDDVLQQAYTDAFLAIGRFVPQSDGAFLAWLSKLARNAMLDTIDMLQAAKRGGDRRQLQADPERSLTTLLDCVRAISATPSRAVASREALVQLRGAIQRLAPDHRTIVELYDLQERTIEEVAEKLGRSVGACYMLRARAHRALCDAMLDSN
ncbi:MAG TPA: sigma-70 family RNA polymerase sigma factor [Phycisphaerales bacterium]|nr:sigma-70 family RNA polymerase sigma factor [Phycisphaerales bacterium]HMP37729.1 sigma-70 family RNA polymerase sigma factor [Phycisphaerales bacterium]